MEAPKSLIKAMKERNIQSSTGPKLQFGILIPKGFKKSETGESYYAYGVIFKRDKEDRVLRNIWDWGKSKPLPGPILLGPLNY